MKLTETFTALSFAMLFAIIGFSAAGLVSGRTIGGCCAVKGCGRCVAVNGTAGKIPTGDCASFKPAVLIAKGCETSNCGLGCFTPVSQECLSANAPIKCVITG